MRGVNSATRWMRVLGFMLVCCLGRAQVQVAISPVPKLQFLDVNGKPLSGGCVFTYAAGTTTPQATYTDSTGTVQNTNPVILDSGGRASIWLTSSAYKFIVSSTGGVNCATGTTQYTIDGISAPNFQTVSSIISASANPAATGFIRMGNGDLINWRNIANAADIGFSQAGAAAAGTGNLADVLRYGTLNTGGIQAQRFLDFSAAPAQSGDLAGGNNVCLVAARNAAGNGDVCAVLVDASNITNLGGSGGSKLVGALNITANSGLPAATPTTLWIAGGFTSPVLGKIYVGDGTGWELDLAKRTGSTDTTLFKFTDAGAFFVNSSITNSAAFQRFRSSGTSCTTGSTNGNACNSSAITLPVAEPDTNYTVICNTEGSNTGSPVIQGAGIKTTTTVVLSVVNTGNVASSYGIAACLVFHD